MRWLTRLTTGIVIAIVVAGGALLIRASIPSTTVRGHFRTYTRFRDGSRLAQGAAVVIAGVRVGVIDRLSVEGRFARIDMTLRDGLDLPVDAFATRRADSLFGDSYVEIIPSSGPGASTELLKSGEPITHVVEGSSADAILRGIATELPRIDNALDIVHDAMLRARKWVSGPLVDGFGGTNTWLAQGRIEDPLERAQRAMVRVDELTQSGAARLAAAGPDVTRALERVDRAVAGARDRIHDVKTGLAQTLQDTREGLDRVDPQIAQASELMSAIDEGRGDDWKGTLGRLVNTSDLADRIEDLTASGAEAVASLNPFRSWLGMRLEYDVFSRDVRFYATAEIRAHQDKFYLVEFERGALGGLPRDALSDVTRENAYVRRQEIHDRLRFTAQFGKQLGPLSVRGGIKDSTFGFGADALLLEGRLKLSADVFGSFTSTPRLKLAGALAVFRTFYVLAGIDDALNEPGYLRITTGNAGAPKTFDAMRFGRDYFVGTTLAFTDEDIAVLLRVYGALLVGLL